MRRILFLILMSPIILLAPSKPKQVALVLPYRALELGVEVKAGEVKVGDVPMCYAVKKVDFFKEHSDSFLYLECDGGKEFKINDIKFENGEKMPLKIIRVDNEK